MKKSILFITACMLFTIAAKATVITVSNDPNNPAQYSDLQAAIDAATAGDTLYVHGSQTSYGNIFITKQLTLLGAGYNPDNQHKLNSQLDNIDIEIGMDGFGNPVSNPSGTKIIGFQLFNIEFNSSLEEITIKGNRIKKNNYGIIINQPLTNSIISNNLFLPEGAYYGIFGNYNLSNSIISNNIFTCEIYRVNSPTVIINNNLFIRGSNWNYSSFRQVSYAVVTNNIFYAMSTSGANYCTFNNNISIGGSQTSFLYDQNTGGGNFVDTNPEFVQVASTSFSYDDDYHLQAISPGKNAGTDGTDIGIYGGAYPFPAFGDALYTGMPAIPQILEMNIMNSSLNATDNLNVQIKAVKTQ